VEARVTSKQAEELARETAARLSVTDAKLSEVALQRSQLEELMQSLSRSRDENLVVDIESAIRLAQQQAQLTGSVQPLLAALNSAEQRLTKVAQPPSPATSNASKRRLWPTHLHCCSSSMSWYTWWTLCLCLTPWATSTKKNQFKPHPPVAGPKPSA
jgi:hypothetical protein